MTDQEKIQKIKEVIWDWAIREVRKKHFRQHTEIDNNAVKQNPSVYRREVNRKVRIQ